MKRFFLLTALVLVMVLTTACRDSRLQSATASPPQESTAESPTEPGSTFFPDPGTSGGYSIDSGTVRITLFTDGTRKFSSVEEKDGTTFLGLTTPQETIILAVNQGRTSYYRQENQTQEQTYPNPLEKIFAGFDSVTFQAMGQGLYRTEYQLTTQVSKTIPYTRYTLSTQWLDGLPYVFDYYVYQDGETLLSAQAPLEIHPELTPDTQWVVELDSLTLVNPQTGESVPFSITETATGESVSPGTVETELITQDFTVEVVKTDGQIRSIRYITQDMDFTAHIFLDYPIPDMEILDTYIPMTEAEAQDAILMLYAAETIL